ncbi:MAG TPA: hypothetical protein VG710_13715 [Opitutus sp.]|nr:hypothetical protein [Opitutus sp.]
MKSALERGAEVIEHWYSLVASQEFSSKEFYDHIETEIAAQKVPALDITRIDLSEGGILSDKREYLRMKRERLTFDVCAAPVGVNYFFSYRFYVEPVVISVWEIIALLLVLWLLFYGSVPGIGPILGPLVLVFACGLLVWLMRNAIGMGLQDLDGALVKLPAIGPIYERYFRKDTYYRQDMRIAYCTIVSTIVKARVEEVTAGKGVKLRREYLYSPVLGDLYKMRSVETGAPVTPVEAA